MNKITLNKVVIEVVYNIKENSYSLLDHNIKILETKDSDKIAKIAKKFEQDDKYTVTFTRIQSISVQAFSNRAKGYNIKIKG